MEYYFEPGTVPVIGPMGLQIKTNGEWVEKATPEIGFLHRGLEKIFEKLTWSSVSTYMEKIDYVSPSHAALAYALAVEKISGIQISERAQTIRRVICELSRITSHLYFLSKFSKEMSSNTVAMHALNEKEKLNDLFEMITGSRLMYNYIRIGGVAADITEGFSDKTIGALQRIKNRLLEFEDLLFLNSLTKQRTKKIGILTLSQALDYGVTGPNLRASGGSIDLRKNSAYSGYEKTKWDMLPRFNENLNGDVYARVRIRLFEIRESIAIIEQDLLKVPDGECKQPIPRTFKCKEGDAYVAVESPRGVLGVYVHSTGDKKPYRIQVRAPSRACISIINKLCKNQTLESIGVILSSLDLLISEVDR